MSPRRKRIILILFVLAGMGIASVLLLTAFEKNLLYFYSPSQVAAGEAPSTRAFRIGGLVMKNSVQRNPDSLEVSFVITDTVNTTKIVYDGILPDLFREGQGIVANGKLVNTGVFQAQEVLAKHDENYMPPEVADALAKAGGTYPLPENHKSK
ncbi:MAG: cytochrome c biogenesis protein CcmE [Gammaproteobacteria bacterium RBG_16_51_14]|nr:MAG: cytochrome c biogenesis protein CcmE [Gammaproteobacteria bacterium RBG_16_51_14]